MSQNKQGNEAKGKNFCFHGGSFLLLGSCFFAAIDVPLCGQIYII